MVFTWKPVIYPQDMLDDQYTKSQSRKKWDQKKQNTETNSFRQAEEKMQRHYIRQSMNCMDCYIAYLIGVIVFKWKARLAFLGK